MPAKGEEALYAQLEDTRTDYLHRNSVRVSWHSYIELLWHVT